MLLTNLKIVKVPAGENIHMDFRVEIYVKIHVIDITWKFEKFRKPKDGFHIDFHVKFHVEIYANVHVDIFNWPSIR